MCKFKAGKVTDISCCQWTICINQAYGHYTEWLNIYFTVLIMIAKRFKRILINVSNWPQKI